MATKKLYISDSLDGASMDLISQFLSMGGHAVFIWSSYLLVFIVLVTFIILSYRRLRKRLDELAEFEKIGSGEKIEEKI
ncbi:MAG: hypothetical protein CFH06_02035 [Alphaproteobacteria bacterium MarineAlpha3_Bin5]|nr:heme exporter protein CcmD [Magnetovibrio sp.]PPR74944.1 MAG: hypothetical protein CFH06_02035 [Alphaproteobacteria bacterium MarineAlpha3_Bin5]|tara:strand:+ start:260 stop:496 length:237 start_codon:yes stop_codon:yes gene_type:complete